MTDPTPGTSGSLDRSQIDEVLLALLLSVVTGIVDAVAFTRLFHVFPANQSGNLILLGIGIGDPVLGESWRPALSMLAFALGVTVAYFVGRRFQRARRRATLQGIECILLVCVALLAGDVSPIESSADGLRLVALLGLSGCAMGLQTVIIGRVAGVGMSTTFETAAIVNLTESTVATGGPRIHLRTVVILAAVLVSYSGGAAIGSFTARHWGYVLWIPAVIIGIGAMWSLVESRRPQGTTAA